MREILSRASATLSNTITPKSSVVAQPHHHHHTITITLRQTMKFENQPHLCCFAELPAAVMEHFKHELPK